MFRQKHLHESIVSQIPNSLNLAVCMYIHNTVKSVWNSFVIVSLVKWNYFNALDCDDYDDGGALINSPFKHFQTNLRNYRRCHALRQYQLQLC